MTAPPSAEGEYPFHFRGGKEGALSLFNDIEAPLINVLETMEHSGVSIDADLLRSLSKELEEDIRILEGEIQLLAGQSFNVDSPKQLGEVLFEMLKIDEKPKKTKTGQYSTSEDVLSKLVHKHDIIPKILDFRTLRKLKSTYVDTLPNMINPVKSIEDLLSDPAPMRYPRPAGPLAWPW